MNKITLVGLDFDNSSFQVDFSPSQSSSSESCKVAEINFKLTGVSMKFSFEQWLQVASQTVEEEKGIGHFEVKDLQFTSQMEPFIN